MKKPWLIVAAGAAVSTVALLAGAWELKAPFNATVNGHQFSEIQISNQECVLQVKLYFDAPADKYQSGARRRNYHQFRAHLSFADNVMVESEVFGNPAPGKRVYSFTKDTAVGGCWAKQKLKLQGVDVQGCRGIGCRVPPFQ
jgi:hypothetical protein